MPNHRVLRVHNTVQNSPLRTEGNIKQNRNKYEPFHSVNIYKALNENYKKYFMTTIINLST